MRSVKLSEHAAVAAECVPCCCIADVDFVDCATFNFQVERDKTKNKTTGLNSNAFRL